MSLVLLVYFLDLVGSINITLRILIILIGISLFVAFLMLSDSDTNGFKLLNSYKIYLIFIIIFYILIPSEKTAYVMCGAYLTQELINSSFAEKVIDNSDEISKKLLIIVNEKLDSYIDNSKVEGSVK